MYDEKAFIDEARRNDSYTSPVFEDKLRTDGTYLWDCCNTDYCAKHDKSNYKFSCLMAGKGERCSAERKLEIREKAKSEGFRFPDFQKF